MRVHNIPRDEWLDNFLLTLGGNVLTRATKEQSRNPTISYEQMLSYLETGCLLTDTELMVRNQLQERRWKGCGQNGEPVSEFLMDLQNLFRE